MAKSKKRHLSRITAILLVLVLVIVVIASLQPKTKPSSTHSNNVSRLKTLTLDNLVTITFPCTTHAVPLKPKNTTNINGEGADCGIKVNNSKQNVVFTAAVERYTNQAKEEKAVINYCTANTTYPGPVSGSTIYILLPTSKTVDGTNFSMCVLSIDGTTAYEATARATKGDYGIILNVDSSSETTATSLYTYLNNFMTTMHVR